VAEEYLRKVAMLVHCSEWLERLSAEFYGLLSEKISDEGVASLMRVISAQSEAHAESMVAVLKLLGLERLLGEGIDCVELTKPVGDAMLELMSIVRSVAEVDALSYQEILERLKFLEVGVGEEAYHRVLQPLLKSLIESTANAGGGRVDLKLKVASDLLDDVTRQEKLHETLVAVSYEILARDIQGSPPRVASKRVESSR